MTGSTEFEGHQESPWAAHRHDGHEEIEERVPAQTMVTVPPPPTLADEAWPTREMMAGRPHRAHRERPKADPPVRKNSALGLAGLVIFTLLAAFFAWVTAGPLWLAIGHGEHGKATVTQCVGSGVSQRCIGDFTSDRGVVVERVALYGVEPADVVTTGPAPALTARMVGSHSGQAYVGAALRGIHLRWSISLALALLCGAGIAVTTGAIRFSDRRARRAAVATSLAAPLLLLIGFLAAAF